ncbi:uncharacterized protein [Diadema setosum]|uniref:uncharacterized protein n=1 Tax=Diadema setosum TaxID=31175 RepID=UPI003B3BCCDA
MGQTPWSAVINLSNSIIGVSVLAMPWCFKECGIILAILLLLLTGAINKFSGNLLLRSAKATRKNSYEFLANHTLGGLGKITVEGSVILLLFATCIAFFVIIGDLGPSLVSKFMDWENTENLRRGILLGTAVFIILPLTQKKNIESLSGLSTVSITFYLFFAACICIGSIPKLKTLDWVNEVTLWRPIGVLKGMSIFALSMCCQPTLFPVYNSLQERTPKQMEDVVSKGVNLVAGVYITIGLFGYITYYQDGVKGDVLLNQAPSLLADVLKLLFALSVAISFPLVVFPCRASIYSLCFPNTADSNPIGGVMYIPPVMFRVITLCILGFTLCIAILIPNVEVVLSLTGSTMGSVACFIMPALIYQHTVGVPARNLPKVLLILGVAFLLFSTYDNLHPSPVDNPIPAPKPVDHLDKLQQGGDLPVIGKEGAADSQEKILDDNVIKDPGGGGDAGPGDKAEVQVEGEQRKHQEIEAAEDKRQEPPIPHAPVDVPNQQAIVKEPEERENKEEEAEKEEERERPKEQEDVGKEQGEADEGKKKRKEEKETEEREEREVGEGANDEAAKKESKENDEEAEEKFKVQEQKQEEQEKKLEELQARQVIQEKLIIQQAEQLDILKKEHEEEKVKKEVEEKQKEEDAVKALQMAGAQVQAAVAQPVAGQGQPQVPAQGQLGQQQPLGQLDLGMQQLPQQPAGQAIGVQPVIGQQPALGQALGQQPALGQALGQQQGVPANLPVAGQLGQDGGQMMAGQVALGQAAGQQLGGPVPGQLGVGQVPQQVAGQVDAAGQLGIGGGQPLIKVGMQAPQMISMNPQRPVGMGANLGLQVGQVGAQKRDGIGLQHVGPNGINQQPGGVMGGLPQLPQQQQPQVGVGQNAVFDGMQIREGAGAPLGQGGPNILQQPQLQGNVAQQVPLALQQQPVLQQQPLMQQQPILQQQPVLQQQVPIQQQQLPLVQQPAGQQLQAGDKLQNQPLLQVVQDAGQVGGMAAGLANDGGGLGNDGLANAIQPLAADGAALQQNQPQQPQPVDRLLNAGDKDALLKPDLDHALAGVQQRVLNQAQNEDQQESPGDRRREEKKKGQGDDGGNLDGEEGVEGEGEGEGAGAGDGNDLEEQGDGKGREVNDQLEVGGIKEEGGAKKAEDELGVLDFAGGEEEEEEEEGVMRT